MVLDPKCLCLVSTLMRSSLDRVSDSIGAVWTTADLTYLSHKPAFLPLFLALLVLLPTRLHSKPRPSLLHSVSPLSGWRRHTTGAAVHTCAELFTRSRTKTLHLVFSFGWIIALLSKTLKDHSVEHEVGPCLHCDVWRCQSYLHKCFVSRTFCLHRKCVTNTFGEKYQLVLNWRGNSLFKVQIPLIVTFPKDVVVWAIVPLRARWAAAVLRLVII